jgi:L-seryl-tRNA(Ser) seleniumtransferase
MGIYDELGIRRIINGSATLTALGGSIMPPEVVRAMVEASQAFVDLHELQRKVGEEIARLTHNEAAYVTSGCAAALVLSTAACVAGADAEKREKLPNTDGMKNEVIVHKHTRVGYDYAIRMVGTRLVEIGSPDGTSPQELEDALSEKTAAMFYFPNAHRDKLTLPMSQAVEICHQRGVPVIVDGAAQIPPKENLWKWTRDIGADLALFSGGKGLRGPQPAGLALGKKDLIEAMRFLGPPNPFIGRGMKVGKEELCGMLAAVRWSLAQDEEAMLRRYEEQVQYVIGSLTHFPGVVARRNFPSEAGQPMPRAELIFDEEKLGITRDEIQKQLKDGEPSIFLSGAGERGVFVNPQTLYNEEERMIVSRLKEILKFVEPRP